MQAAGYTVTPGESLQTHCYYNTAAFSHKDYVTFGVPTSSEMCQDFLFYYPKQTRNGYPFAMCGVAESGPGSFTLCGSLAQPNLGFVLPLSDQVARGDVHFPDPLNFTVANLATLSSDDIDTCTPAPSPPPPPAPSTTTSSPPTPGAPNSWPTISFTAVASGDVSDYSPSVINGIKASVASSVSGVDVSQVTVQVASASVLLSITIAVPDESTLDLVTTQVMKQITSPSATTTFLTSQLPAGTITVTEIRSNQSETSSDITVVILAVVGGLAGLALLIGLAIMKKRSKQVAAQSSKDSVKV